MISSAPLPLGYSVGGATIRVDEFHDQLRIFISMHDGTVAYERLAELSKDEISDYYEKARDCFASISSEICQDPKKWKEKSSEILQAYHELAEVGATMANRLIPKKKLQRELLKILKNGHTIQINSKNIFPPIEAFYFGNPFRPSGVDFNKFWGMHGVISRSIIRQKYIPPPAVFKVPPMPKVKVAAYEILPAVKEKEIPNLKKLEANGLISLDQLEPLSNKLSLKSNKKFCDFFNKKHEISHWACHCEGIDKSHKSALFFTDDFQMRLDAAQYMKLRLKGSPIVHLMRANREVTIQGDGLAGQNY